MVMSVVPKRHHDVETVQNLPLIPKTKLVEWSALLPGGRAQGHKEPAELKRS